MAGEQLLQRWQPPSATLHWILGAVVTVEVDEKGRGKTCSSVKLKNDNEV